MGYEFSSAYSTAYDVFVEPAPTTSNWEGREVSFSLAKLFRIRSPHYNFKYRMNRPGSGVISTRRYDQDSWRQD